MNPVPADLSLLTFAPGPLLRVPVFGVTTSEQMIPSYMSEMVPARFRARAVAISASITLLSGVVAAGEPPVLSVTDRQWQISWRRSD